jgi:charged multivesicular body protein 6
MLSNNLTLDDEDAVQAELKELQAEVVHNVQIEKAAPEQKIQLPSVPTTKPVIPVAGEPLIVHN